MHPIADPTALTDQVGAATAGARRVLHNLAGQSFTPSRDHRRQYRRQLGGRRRRENTDRRG